MENQQSTIIDYLGGFQYKDGSLDFIHTPEGYVKAVHAGETTEYHYVYNYTDHLGNIRLSYGHDPETDEVAILKESHYYPFGLQHNGYVSNHMVFEPRPGGRVNLTPVRNYLDDTYRYDFNAKEHQPELGLNWHDYHARNYDAALGRWMNVDPASELYSGFSPYTYTLNNPLRYIDPTGMLVELPDEPGEIEGDKYYDDDTGDTYEWDGEGGWHSDMQRGEELNEVVVTSESSSEDNTNPDLNDVGWFLSSNLSAVERNSNYNSKNYTARYGTRNLSGEDITRQTRAQMGRCARNAKFGGGIVTIGFGGYDVYSGWKQDGKQFGYNSHLAVGRVVGGVGGAWLGAQAGATAGLLTVNPYVPVITAIGGAFIGGYYGSMAGESFVEWLYKE